MVTGDKHSLSIAYHCCFPSDKKILSWDLAPLHPHGGTKGLVNSGLFHIGDSAAAKQPPSCHKPDIEPEEMAPSPSPTKCSVFGHDWSPAAFWPQLAVAPLWNINSWHFA